MHIYTFPASYLATRAIDRDWRPLAADIYLVGHALTRDEAVRVARKVARRRLGVGDWMLRTGRVERGHATGNWRVVLKWAAIWPGCDRDVFRDLLLGR